jgi:hypothetical protein
MSFPAQDEASPRQPRRRLALSSIPPSPRPPSPRARRLIFRYQGKQLVMLILGVVFLLFGSIFPVVFGWGLPVDLAIAVSGTTVQGKGLDARVNHSVRINRAHPTLVRFSYELEGQRMGARLRGAARGTAGKGLLEGVLRPMRRAGGAAVQPPSPCPRRAPRGTRPPAGAPWLRQSARWWPSRPSSASSACPTFTPPPGHQVLPGADLLSQYAGRRARNADSKKSENESSILSQ